MSKKLDEIGYEKNAIDCALKRIWWTKVIIYVVIRNKEQEKFDFQIKLTRESKKAQEKRVFSVSIPFFSRWIPCDPVVFRWIPFKRVYIILIEISFFEKCVLLTVLNALSRSWKIFYDVENAFKTVNKTRFSKNEIFI